MSSEDVLSGKVNELAMLEDVFIPGTKQTPEITCNNKTAEISLKGNFISSNPSELIEPIQKWLYSFVQSKKSSVISLIFHLTYLNGCSGKYLNSFFRQIEDYQDRGFSFSVQLYYEDDDVDMLEWCKEVKNTYKLPCNLSKVN